MMLRWQVLVLTFMTPELHILHAILLRSDTGYTCDTRPTIPELATFLPATALLEIRITAYTDGHTSSACTTSEAFSTRP